MKRSRLNAFAAVFCLASFSLWLIGGDTVFARDREFNEVVDHLQAHYGVHQNYRFVSGLAGLVVKFWHVGGVKNLKMAIFEDQPFRGCGSDTELEGVVREALKQGWQPVVQTYSRHSGERTYIYGQAPEKRKDIKLLIVNLEENEAEVIQVKVNPDKLSEFINENSRGRR